MDTNLGWINKMMVSTGGEEIGPVIDTHIDAQTGEPDWLAVKTGGRFKAKKRFVPIEAATHQGDAVVVPFEKDKVRNAPEVEAIGVLTDEEASTLYAYYGMHSHN